MKYGRKLAREKGKTEQESEEERGKSLQSQGVMTIFVFYCHITNYYRLCCLKQHTFIFIFLIAYIYYLIVSIGQKSRHNFAGFSASKCPQTPFSGFQQAAILKLAGAMVSRYGLQQGIETKRILYKQTSVLKQTHVNRQLCRNRPYLPVDPHTVNFATIAALHSTCYKSVLFVVCLPSCV